MVGSHSSSLSEQLCSVAGARRTRSNGGGSEMAKEWKIILREDALFRLVCMALRGVNHT